MRIATTLAATLALVPSLARAEGVRIVHPSGTLDFEEIQAAVDAASDGDVLLVAQGTYPAFTIDGKGLSVLAAEGTGVLIEGTIEVRNVPSGSTVLLAGMYVAGATVIPRSEPALWLRGNSGDVRAQGCSFLGGDGTLADPCLGVSHGGNAVEAQGSLRVAFVQCAVRGGAGLSSPTGDYCTGAGDGGDGIVAEGSVFALYEVDVRGGDGGDDPDYAGDGGAGHRALGLGVFASGSSIRGGDGGDAWDFINPFAGDGGDGLIVTGTSAALLDTELAGGAAGIPSIPQDVPPEAGLPSSGDGSIAYLPGEARLVESIALAPDADELALHFEGRPGDRAYLVRATSPAFAFAPTLSGVWLASPSRLGGALPLGVLPATGKLDVEIKLADLAAMPHGERQYLQGLMVGVNGEAILANPLHLAVLDRASPPDCDGNGSVDYLDAIEGSHTDCNLDLIVDDCQIAAGSIPDCNGNGVPDVCDVDSGSSADSDANGVPDECEGPNWTWHVDAGASHGGNGSAGFPFRTIGEGLAAARTGDTVLVAGGLYVGAQNRELAFAGRDIAVVGAAGAASCVIDCQGLGRAFSMTDGEGPGARVEGFTIRNGSADIGGAIQVQGSDPTIQDCVIEDCTASGGGGLHLVSSSARVSGCTLARNHSWADSGGAMIVWGGAPRIEQCTFRENVTTGFGGAMKILGLQGGTPLLVSHCIFDGNLAGVYGGAVFMDVTVTPSVLGNCLFSGNSAEGGGAIGSRGEVFLLDCTLVDNRATTWGGGLMLYIGASGFVANGVLWGNSAPDGPTARVMGTSVLTVRYCDVEGGAGSIRVLPSATLDWQTGNLELDPLFAAPAGADGDPGTTADNDYRLGAFSPCADAGDDPRIAPDLYDVDMDGLTLEAAPYDLDGAPRQTDDPAVPDTGNGAAPIVDLGAYERQP